MNIQEDYKSIKEYFSPKVLAEVNNSYVKIAKIKGNDLPWHVHQKEDEFFFIIEGKLLMEIQNQDSFLMKEGDYYVVKRGIKHRISSEKECKIMLVEDKTTAHTGEVHSAITKTIEDQLRKD